MRIGRTRIAGLLAATAWAILAASPVAAHERLVASDPEADAVLADTPETVTLTFSGELEADSGFEILDATGTVVGTGGLDLDVAERNVLHGAVAITVPGRYVVRWTITGLDGHALAGELAFSVGDPPDTAMRVPGAVAVTGVILVLGAGVLGIRRLAAREPT